MTRRDWKRVTRRSPCPICGATGWCAISGNGEVCLCMRVESDWPVLTGMGGHVHRLVAEPTAPPPPRPAHSGPVITVAESGEISEWVLGQLHLKDEHVAHLEGPRRQLNAEQIGRRGYRSWPGLAERRLIAKRAQQEFGWLMRGFPGFYVDVDQDAYFVGPQGLLLPVRDVTGTIAGFQVRPDDASRGKRLWLSSIGRKYGTGSGAPSHVSTPTTVTWEPVILYVVEGVLSADICSDLLGAPCIGLSGVSNWRGVDWENLIHGVDATTVVIALDQGGDEVRARTEETLLTSVCCEHARTKTATWDGTLAKGLDDCLNAGLRLTAQ